jgi:hypothetical protein
MLPWLKAITMLRLSAEKILILILDMPRKVLTGAQNWQSIYPVTLNRDSSLSLNFLDTALVIMLRLSVEKISILIFWMLRKVLTGAHNWQSIYPVTLNRDSSLSLNFMDIALVTMLRCSAKKISILNLGMLRKVLTGPQNWQSIYPDTLNRDSSLSLNFLDIALVTMLRLSVEKILILILWMLRKVLSGAQNWVSVYPETLKRDSILSLNFLDLAVVIKLRLSVKKL